MMKLDSQAYRECTRCSTRYLSRGGSTASVCHNCRTELKVMENAGSQGCNMTCADCGTAYHSASGTTKVCPLCRPQQVTAPPTAASTFPHTKMPVGPGILSVRNVNTHNSMTGQKRATEPAVCEEKAAPEPAPAAQAESNNNDAETARTELLSVSERGGAVCLPPGDWGRPHRRGSFASLASDSVAAAAAAAAHHEPAAPTHKAHASRTESAGAARRAQEHDAHRRHAPHRAREEEAEEPDFRLPLRPVEDEVIRRPSYSQSPSLSPSSVPVDKPYYEFQPYDKHEMQAQPPRRAEHWDDDAVASRRTSSNHHRRRDSDRSQYRSHHDHDDRRSSGHHHHHRHRREDSVDHRSRQHRSHHQTQHRGVPQRRYASASSRSPSYTTDTYSRTDEASPARDDWCLRDAAAGRGRTTQPQEQQRTQHAQVRGGGNKGDRVLAAAPQSRAVRDTRVPHRRVSAVDDYSESVTGTDAAYGCDYSEERRPRRGSDRHHADRHDLRRRSNRSPSASRSVGTSRTSRTMTSTATNTRATMVDAAVQNDPPSAPLVVDAQPLVQATQQQQQQQQAPPVPSVTTTQQPDGPVLFARPLAPPPPTVSVVAAPPPVVMAAPPQYALQQAPQQQQPQLLLQQQQQQATPQAMFAQAPNAAAYAGQATPILLPSQPQVNPDYAAQAAATPVPGQATQVPYGYTLGPAPGNLPPDLAGDRKRRYYHAGPASVAAPSSAAPAAAPYVPPPAKAQGRIQSSYTPSPQRTARHRTVNGWDQYVGDGESRSPSRSLSPYDRPDYARHVVSHYNEQGTPAAPPVEAQSPHAIWEAGHTPQMANRAAAAFGRRM